MFKTATKNITVNTSPIELEDGSHIYTMIATDKSHYDRDGEIVENIKGLDTAVVRYNHSTCFGSPVSTGSKILSDQSHWVGDQFHVKFMVRPTDEMFYCSTDNQKKSNGNLLTSLKNDYINNVSIGFRYNDADVEYRMIEGKRIKVFKSVILDEISVLDILSSNIHSRIFKSMKTEPQSKYLCDALVGEFAYKVADKTPVKLVSKNEDGTWNALSFSQDNIIINGEQYKTQSESKCLCDAEAGQYAYNMETKEPIKLVDKNEDGTWNALSFSQDNIVVDGEKYELLDGIDEDDGDDEDMEETKKADKEKPEEETTDEETTDEENPEDAPEEEEEEKPIAKKDCSCNMKPKVDATKPKQTKDAFSEYPEDDEEVQEMTNNQMILDTLTSMQDQIDQIMSKLDTNSETTTATIQDATNKQLEAVKSINKKIEETSLNQTEQFVKKFAQTPKKPMFDISKHLTNF